MNSTHSRRFTFCTTARSRVVHGLTALTCAGGLLTSTATAQFSRVLSGGPATDPGESVSAAWGDYDGDGRLDLFVARYSGENDLLYHNEGGGVFSSVSSSALVTDGATTAGGAWADFDNNGTLDLAVVGLTVPSLHVNDGTTAFTRRDFDPTASAPGSSMTCAWSDVNHDGLLDLVVANGGGYSPQNEFLFLARANGTFVADPLSPLSNSGGYSVGSAFADYDGDGNADLAVVNLGTPTVQLYRGDGTGAFTLVTAGPVATTPGVGVGCTWGDYDNDGRPDLFVSGEPNQLFHNEGGGRFVAVTDAPMVTGPVQNFIGSAWFDYDNDGWLDLFVANRTGNNALYHNAGNGAFTRVTEGGVVTDGGASNGCAVGDYDGDGYLDLLVANWGGQVNFLYHNDGGANQWLKVRCQGARSNRDGIGAKVRVQATVNGQTLSQSREITGGGSWGSQTLDAHFGLGNATNIDLVRIEWPSGIVQELRDVAPGQLLTLAEAPTPLWARPLPGEYYAPVQVSLYTGVVGGEIRFTTDGAEPTSSSPLYASPIQVLSSTTLKAQVFTNAVAASEVLTASYVIVLPPPDAFQRVTTGAPATDTGEAFTAAWADYDVDGRPDLFVSRLGGQRNALYHNEGGGAFAPVPTVPPVAEPGTFTAGAWADANSDGRPDVLVTSYPGAPQLFLNDGAGSFAGPDILATEPAAPYSMGPAWADVNRDGVLDFFIANGGGSAQQNNILALGLPGGGFQIITNSPATATVGYSCGASFADFDGDLAPDLVVANMWATGQLELYRNDGTGNLVAVTDTPVTQSAGSYNGTAWGDYDNDGRPDLFVAGAPSGLFRNLGGGQFASVTTGVPMVANPPPNAIGCAWLDHNNDGWLDLFVTSRGGNNVLYRNQGDGTFVTITEGDFVDDAGASNGCAVGDYDNDGYPDLFVANWGGEQSFLYRNGGGTHHWLKVRCVGVRSTRDGIGAAVRIRTVGESALNQWREITGGDAYGSHPLIAHFGLGTATNVDLLRIEWPSGIVQELQNVAADQTLSITEAAGPLWFRPWPVEYHTPVEVRIETSIEGAETRYTLDGSDPTTASALYPPSPRLLATTEIKAQAYTNGVAASDIVSATYTVILTPPSIVSQPTNVVAYEGQTTSIPVVATGSAPLVYQWLFAGTELADATQPTLILTNLTPAMTGEYVLRITNDAGAILSAPITLSVVPPPQRPSILQQPASQMVVTGGRAVFSVVVTGDPPLTYAWRRIGQSTILGTDPTLTLENVQPSQAGSYRVIITNPVGSATSAAASLIVVSQPQAPTITTQTGAQRPTAGDPVTLSVAVTGTQPLVYLWTRNGESLPTAQGPSLTLDAVTPAMAGTYAVRVSNDAGSAVSQPIIVDVIDDQAGGTVLFDNLTESIDAPVFDDDGATRLSGMAFLAQLYAGPAEDALRPVGAALPFGTANAAGYWLPGVSAVRTIPTVPPGAIAVVRVRAWETAFGPSFEQALVSGGKVGSSRYVFVTTGGGGEPPGVPSPLTGLQSFNLARESEPPVITVQSPEAGATVDERFSLTGSITDNGRLAAVRWELDHLAMGPVPFTNGLFALDNLRRHRGTNAVRVIATDAAGNEAAAEVTTVWTPLRSLALRDGPPIQEGGRISLPLVLTSSGDVAGLTFAITFDPLSLEDPTLEWSPALEGATRAITVDPAGRVRATLAFAGQAIPAGEVTLAEVSFRARSIPEPRATPLGFELADISNPAGDPLTYGTDVLGANVELTLRAFVGDNNANQRLDVGDASIIQRLLNSPPPLQAWDVTGNDLNRSLTLDSGDVIKVLRVVVGLDEPPTGSTPVPQTTLTRRRGLLPQGPPAAAGRVTLTGQRVTTEGGEQVVLQVGLADLDRPISGASFVLRYPASVLVVSGTTAHRTGSLVPASALALWNITEDYTQQIGVLSCATASGDDWTATNGVLAEITFTLRPGLLATLADLEVGPLEITTAHGFEVVSLDGAQLAVDSVLPVSPDMFTAPRLTPTGFQFTLAGPVGGQAIVEVSTDLVHWEPLSTVPLTTSTGLFEDPAALTQSARFYRVK